MPNEHDNAVEKVLAALKSAAPPEGMDARIAERLRQHAQAPTTSSWRDRFAGSTLTAAWWRGALAGAAMATLAIGIALFIQHSSRPLPQPNQAIATNPTSAPITATPVAQTHSNACPSPGRRVHATAPVFQEAAPPTTETLRVENRAPSRPAPAMPLTPQERGLARLVRTADPRQLATLNPETQAKLEAEDAAEFEKFFTPPPPPKPIEQNE